MRKVFFSFLLVLCNYAIVLMMLATAFAFMIAIDTGDYASVFCCLFILIVVWRFARFCKSQCDVLNTEYSTGHYLKKIGLFIKKWLLLFFSVLWGILSFLILLYGIDSFMKIDQPQYFAYFVIQLIIFYIFTRITAFFHTKYKMCQESGFDKYEEYMEEQNDIEYGIEKSNKMDRHIYFKCNKRQTNCLEKVKTGYDFEKYCGDILNENGWSASTTKKSGDQGVDVIAVKNGIKVAIQCKYHKQPKNKTIGNRAVQEVNTGKALYKADYAAVVTNSLYSSSARELAKANAVVLLKVRDLPNLEESIKILQ